MTRWGRSLALSSRELSRRRKARWKMASPEPGSSVSPIPWVAALLLILGIERALALPEICTRCPGGVHNLSRVAAYCENTSKLMQARCCLNQKGTILG